MKTRCPNCDTVYSLDADALDAADGLARCHRCRTVFDARAEQAVDKPPSARPLRLDMEAEAHWQDAATASAAHDLPFDVPDDLEPLEPSPDVSLDVTDTLYEKPRRFRALYVSLVLLLALGLGLQFAWQHRVELLERFPQLEPICDHLQLPCVVKQVHAPNQLQVLQRDMRPADNQPGTLNLSARVRNNAEAPQSLPDIQLSLIDNNGSVLIRRRLTPRDYLFPPPPSDRLIAPGEVFTISIDFKDPGYLATGFMIDFL